MINKYSQDKLKGQGPRQVGVSPRRIGISATLQQAQQAVPLLSGIAIGIYAFETIIPKQLPWLRLGLSNAVILCVVVIFGLKYALLVSIIRTTVGSLLTGMFLNPFFFFGLFGGIASAFVMWVFYVIGKRIFSLIGISIIGALTHNVVQLYLAYIMYIKSAEVFYLLPIFILLSVITGTITGVGAIYLNKILSPSLQSEN